MKTIIGTSAKPCFPFKNILDVNISVANLSQIFQLLKPIFLSRPGLNILGWQVRYENQYWKLPNRHFCPFHPKLWDHCHPLICCKSLIVKLNFHHSVLDSQYVCIRGCVVTLVTRFVWPFFTLFILNTWISVILWNFASHWFWDEEC